MNHNRYLVIISLTFLMSCDRSSKSTKAENSQDSITQKKEAPGNETVPEDPTAGLMKMAPLNEKEMIELLPLQLMGLEKRNEQVDGGLGTLSATAVYGSGDSLHLELIIIDCAGPAGVGVYNIQYAAMLEASSEDAGEYTRIVDFKGEKAIERCSKTNADCTLRWFSGRYFISLEGNLPAEQLKQVASTVNP